MVHENDIKIYHVIATTIGSRNEPIKAQLDLFHKYDDGKGAFGTLFELKKDKWNSGNQNVVARQAVKNKKLQRMMKDRIDTKNDDINITIIISRKDPNIF